MPEFNEKKINVMQVVGVMNRGGAEVMVMDIYRKISEDINFNFLINYKPKAGIVNGQFDSDILDLGAKINHIGAQWDIGPIKYIKEFKRICTEVGTPDIIHIHMNAKSGLICLAARLAGIKKIIVHSHGELKLDFRSLKGSLSSVELILQRLLINSLGTDFWGCSDKAIKSLFSNSIINSEKSKLIKNAIDVDKFILRRNYKDINLKNSLKKTSDTIIIGTVGRVVRRKNLKFIIEILNILKNNDCNFKFINVGKVDDSDYMREVNSLVDKFDLHDNFLQYGLTDDVPKAMSIFDVFLSPAKNEAFGIVAIEAQAMGIPCLLSTGFPEAVDVNLGLTTFISGYKPEVWADQILKHNEFEGLKDSAIKKAFSDSGFDIATNIKTIEELYRN